MRVLLFLASIGVGVLAAGFTFLAASSIHQIFAAVMWLIATLLFVGAAIIDAVVNGANKICRQLKERG